jgi:hypothetical protein
MMAGRNDSVEHPPTAVDESLQAAAPANPINTQSLTTDTRMQALAGGCLSTWKGAGTGSRLRGKLSR